MVLASEVKAGTALQLDGKLYKADKQLPVHPTEGITSAHPMSVIR